MSHEISLPRISFPAVSLPAVSRPRPRAPLAPTRTHRAPGSALESFEFVPRRIDRWAPILVSVHGISLNAREHCELFAPWGEERGIVVIAPLFEAERFPGFQRMAGRGANPGRQLERVVDDARRRLGLRERGFALFGFSGGGQFAHRYALQRPRRVRSLVIAAPGWYTFPDPSLPYPLGIGPSPRYRRAHCRLRSFLQIPIRVLVGELDVERDPSLNQEPEIDRLQGLDRVQRSVRWVEAVREAARANGLPPCVTHSLLPGTGHSFQESVERGGLARLVFDSL